MEQNGFVNFGKIATPYARDIIFVQDFLRSVKSNSNDISIAIFLINFLFELAGICGTITMTNESIFELRKECEIIKNTHLDVDQ